MEHIAYKIGKVTKFDNYIGEIVDNLTKYTFLDTDLQETVSVGDLVSFSSENINGQNRAFFISKYNFKNEKDTNYLKLEK